MNKYRIRPVVPNKWVVEKKGWFFWHSVFGDFMLEWEIPETFDSVEAAKERLHNHLEAEQKRKAQNAMHLAQPTIYL